MRTTKTWSISLPPRLEKEAQRAAREENRTKSELIREALRRYLQGRKLRNLQAYGAMKAKESGMSGEENVDHLVHQYRRERRRG